MSHLQPFLSAAHGDAVGRILEAILGSGVSALLSGPAGIGKTAVLNVVDAKLALRSRRVVRVSAAAKRPFGMHELSAQLAGLPQAGELADDHVMQALAALASADGDRVVLIVDDAEALLPEALCFVQLACETHPALQVIFAGRPEFQTCLDGRELAFLRGRLAPTLALGGLSDSEAAAFIGQRLRAAGLASKTPVADHTLATLIEHGQGNPRRIGAVLDRALAVQRRPTPDPTPDMRRVEHAGPSASRGGRRRTYRPAWALAALGLIGATGLVIAIPASRALRQANQLTAISIAPGTASGTSDLAETAQTQPTVPNPAASIDPEAVRATAPPPDDAAALLTTPAQPVVPTDTTVGDAAPSAGGAGPAAPPSSPVLAAGPRSASLSKPLGNAVPHAASPERGERLTIKSTNALDDRSCRDVLLRMQLGEDPSDADRNRLRNGCRRNR